MFAFAIENYFTKENKYNTDYVTFVPMYTTVIDGERKDRVLDMHLCTEDDYAKFYEPAK